jgi:YD repeat-containing protein
MKKPVFVASLLALSLSVPAQAGETVTYRYDARGRLVKVERTGTVNNGATTNYEIDKAHNRKRVVTTGAPSP